MEYRLFRLSNGLCSYSPNGLYAAIVNQQRLTVCSQLPAAEPVVFTCTDVIEYVEWSADSELILTAYLTKGKLQVWSVEQPDWKCKISTGTLGSVAACFAPGSRHIITTSNLHLRMTVWSLIDKTVRHINLPKEASPGLDFSPGGSHMAVAERRAAKDCIAIYSCDCWVQVTLIDCETIDLGGLRWSPDGTKIAVWDQICSGKLTIYSISGLKLSQTEHFGIQNIEWAPTMQILSLITVGSKVKLINHLTWHPITTLVHDRLEILSDQECIIYEESSSKQQYHVLTERPFVLGGAGDCGNPGGHVTQAFSPDAQYLATWHQVRPNILYLWHIAKLSLQSILVHQSPISNYSWSPTEARLAISCGSGSIYAWTPSGCAVINLKSDALNSQVPVFAIERIQWNCNGQHVLVSGKHAACICTIK